VEFLQYELHATIPVQHTNLKFSYEVTPKFSGQTCIYRHKNCFSENDSLLYTEHRRQATLEQKLLDRKLANNATVFVRTCFYFTRHCSTWSWKEAFACERDQWS